MNNKVVFITGASKGLGYTLAEAMQKKNYYVYSGVRDLSKAPKGTTPLFIDLVEEKSLERAVQTIIAEKGRIDILINNAGIAYWGPAESLTSNEVRELFEINTFAPFRLTQLVLPHMRERKSGKIFFISSIRGAESCAYMGMYSASKSALEALAFDLAITLEKWCISVSVVQPGPMDTGIELKHGNYFSATNDNPYLPYKEGAVDWESVNEVSEVILKKLEDRLCPFRFQTSKTAEAIVANHLIDPSGMKWYNQQKTWINN